MLSNGAGAILNLILVSISETGLVPIQAIFGTCVVASIIAFIICWRFDEKIDSKEMQEMENQGEIEWQE
jgi:hypothetical protein